MTRPPTDSRHDILHAAAQLFRERGYDAASMNDLAAALNLSKGALYHHFQSKDEILFHIMEHAMQITEEQVKKPVLELKDPQERLRACIRLHPQLFQQGGNGQSLHGTVHRQAHGVALIVGADKDHRPLKPQIIDPRHRHQQASGEIGRGRINHGL